MPDPVPPRSLRRGRGQVSAVDGRTAGRVGDNRAVAVELRKKLYIGCFTAACAGAGELEERALHGNELGVGKVELVGFRIGKIKEELPVRGFFFAVFREVFHVDCLDLGIVLGLGRALLYAESAAGAVFRGSLNGKLPSEEFSLVL